MLCRSRVQPSLLGEERRLDSRKRQKSSLLIFCQVPNCKMFNGFSQHFANNSGLKAYARILYTRIQNKENSFSLCGKLSSHWKQQWPVKKRKNKRLAHTYQSGTRVFTVYAYVRMSMRISIRVYAYWADANYAYILVRTYLSCTVCNMKQLGVFLLSPGWDASPTQGCPHPPYTFGIPGWREALWGFSVLPKNTTEWSQQELEPRLLNPESSANQNIPMCPQQKILSFHHYCKSIWV